MADEADDARLRYSQQKRRARERGIEFDFTFEEWWEVWAPHYANRGRGRDQLQMCRTADEGAYRSGNVRIDTGEANAREAQVTAMRRQIVRDWGDRAELREWVFDRNRPFDNPLRQLIRAEEAEEDEDETA